MKTAVETVFVGKDRQFNRRFLQMCGHYLVEPTACTPASGWEKGQSLPSRKRGSKTRSATFASGYLPRGCG
jgi:transposase